MKIEICEQMVHSWLINCKLCESAQTNWKVSPLYLKTISQSKIDYLQDFINDINVPYPKLFNVDATQMIAQCEVDIVGLKQEDGILEHVYFIDTAFHIKGLNYKDSPRQVTMKIARAAAVSWAMFGKDVPVKIIFAAPKCGPKPTTTVVNAATKVMPFIKKYFPAASVEILFNEDFAVKIFEPLIKNMRELYDDTDLYMRAIHLAKICEAKLPASSTAATTKGKASKATKSKASAVAPASASLPTITLTPSDPAVFKAQLLTSKMAEFTWVYSDGTEEDKTWRAGKFTAKSDVYNNIKSRPQWRDKANNGLVEVKVKAL